MNLRSQAVREISTHALREEGDRSGVGYWYSPSLFLPTPSVRRATVDKGDGGTVDGISTHALREEGDPGPKGRALRAADFYPRPP